MSRDTPTLFDHYLPLAGQRYETGCRVHEESSRQRPDGPPKPLSRVRVGIKPNQGTVGTDAQPDMDDARLTASQAGRFCVAWVVK